MQMYLPGFEPDLVAAPVADRLRDLGTFPHVSGEVLSRYAVAIGNSGERLVDSLLLRAGELVLEVPGDLANDRLVLRPKAVVLLQIKTCSRPTDGAYTFEFTRGFPGRAAATRRDRPGEFHVACLVCLDENVVRFTASQHPRHRVRQQEVPSLRAYPLASWNQALADAGVGHSRQDAPEQPLEQAGEQPPEDPAAAV